MRRYFPISRYEPVSLEIRSLMQRAEAERGICRDGPGADGPVGLAAMRGCNMAHRAEVLLEEKGWCWGGAEIEADKHWLPCARVSHHVAGSLRAEGDPFSPSELREKAREGE